MFASLMRAEGASDRSAWGDFWFQPVGRATGGRAVAADDALALPTAWACVRNIAEDVAKLPFRLMRPRAGGGRDPITKHWLYALLAVRPNDWQTPFEWREMVMGHLQLRGNAYNLIEDDGQGGIAALVPRHPDRMRMELLDNGSFRYRYTDQFGNQVIYRRDQIWHLRGFGGDGFMGYSVIETHRQHLGEALSAQEFAARFFENDAKPSGGWIEYPGKFADKDKRSAFRDSWQEAQRGANRGKVAVLENGMKFHEIGMTNRDSQYLETRAAGAVATCAIFRMPPHKVGILDRATFSNIEQQNIEYAVDTVCSHTSRICSSLRTLLGDEDAELEPEFDYRMLMRGDAKSRADAASVLINCGAITRNEARDDEGRNPLPGLSKPLRPLNTVEIGEDGETEEPDEPAAADDVPTEPAPVKPAREGADKAGARRLAALVQASAQRLARRAAGELTKKAAATVFDDHFAALVAESMAIPVDQAREFCAWSIAYLQNDTLAQAGLATYEKQAALMLTHYGERHEG